MGLVVDEANYCIITASDSKERRHAHTRIHTHAHAKTRTHPHAHTKTCMRTQTPIHMHIHMHTHAHKDPRPHTCTRTHKRTAGESEPSRTALQEMKIWDIRKLSCVQDIIDTTLHKPQNKMTCIALDAQRGSLVRPPLRAPRRAAQCRVSRLMPVGSCEQNKVDVPTSVVLLWRRGGAGERRERHQNLAVEASAADAYAWGPSAPNDPSAHVASE